jgi:hypothetical protein
MCDDQGRKPGKESRFWDRLDKGQKLIGLAVGILAVLLAIPVTSYSVRAVSAWIFGGKGMVYYEAYLDPRIKSEGLRVDGLQVPTPIKAVQYCVWVTDRFELKGEDRKKFLVECCDHETPEQYVWNNLEPQRNVTLWGPHPAPIDASIEKYCQEDKDKCATDSTLRAVSPRKPMMAIFTEATGPLQPDMGFGTILQAEDATSFRFVPWQFEAQRPGVYDEVEANDRRRLRHLNGLSPPKAKANACSARHPRDPGKCDYKAYPQKFILRPERCVVVLSRAKDGIKPKFASVGSWFFVATTACGFFR